MANKEQHYNHIANQNREKGTQAYREFIQSHTPLEIHKANNARNQLKRMQGKKNSSLWAHIKDERQVKHPVSSFAYFTQARQATQDYKGMTLATGAGLIAREWKALPAAEKKVSPGYESFYSMSS